MSLLQDLNIAALDGEDPQKQIESVVKQLNEWARQLSNEDRTKIIKDDSGTERLLLGYEQGGFGGGNIGLKISQEGIGVVGADDSDLIFNSSQNVLKIVQSGTLDLTQASVASPGAGNYASGTGTLATLSHGLDYTPAYIVYLEFSTGVRALLPFDNFSTPSATQARWDTYYAAISASSLFIQYRISVYGMGAATFAPPVAAKYYLLQESAT